MEDERFPVCNVIEQSIKNQTNSLMGTNDVNMNTIVKMELMDEMGLLDELEKVKILKLIRQSNVAEKFLIESEYGLTYDLSGDIVPIYINESVEQQGDSTSFLFEPEGSKK